MIANKRAYITHTLHNYSGETPVAINNTIDQHSVDSSDGETNKRIQTATAAYGHLDSIVWSPRGIENGTKCRLYGAVIKALL